MSQSICGKCLQEFKSDEDYASHVCEVSGLTPLDPEHLGEHFLKIQEKALERGEVRKEIEQAAEAAVA